MQERLAPRATEDRDKVAAVYAMFSALLQPPARSVHEEVVAGRPVQLWGSFPAPGKRKPGVPRSWLPQNFPSYDEWRKIHGRVMPAVNPAIIPVESIYKVWTTDPSCEMPFARQTGLLQGDSAQHLYQVYREFGIELPPQYADSPDHLVLELEFMGILVEAADLEAQRLFLAQHLDWLPDLIADAEHKRVPDLYRDLFGWIADFLAIERQRTTCEPREER